ncbi:dead-box atp-dependent rna helicase 47 mitochondrial [Holotrichia oblita]|nr:dead-box atp-dependent rna helicase 47 mitochondrial [Holotrichia oblita]
MDYEKSYNERLECGSKAIYNRLKDLYPNENDFEKALHDLSEALTAYEKVYIEIENTVKLIETISHEGFIHPGIGCTAETLSVMREKVLSGVSPWVDYFEGLRRTSYAKLDIKPKYVNQIHDDVGIYRFANDAQTAWAQAIIYIVTGNEEYRKIPLEIIKWYGARTEESFFPKAFTDSHIKIGKYVYTMCAAAEIMRYTSPMDPALAVTSEMIDNLDKYAIKPIRRGTLEHNGYFMNQHTYAIIGYMASAIMSDDMDGYCEVVEWTTVNASAKNQGRNGSIKMQIREMTKNDQTGEAVEPILQLTEMGRDQDHAGGNINNLLMMTKTMDFQKTKVDPVLGTVTDKNDGVSPIRFLDDRLIKGSALFVKYNMGYALDWVPAYAESGGEIDVIYGGISQLDRGDLITNGVPASYYTFNGMGYDMDSNQYKYIKTAVQSLRSAHEARARSGNFIETLHNYAFDFWIGLNENSSDALPSKEKASRAISADLLPYKKDRDIIRLKGRFFDMSATAQENDIYPGSLIDIPLELKTDEDGNEYVRMTIKNSPRTITLQLNFPKNEMGFFVRSNKMVKLNLHKSGDYKKDKSFQSAYIPNTNNEWKYVYFCFEIKNLLYIEAESIDGTAEVDFGYINLNIDEVEPVKFESVNEDELIITYPENKTERVYTAIYGGEREHKKIKYSSSNLPEGAVIDENSGTLTWTPSLNSPGDYSSYIIAQNSKSVCAVRINIHVAVDRHDALRYAAKKYDPNEIYESKTTEAFNLALKTNDIYKIQKAAEGLLLLNPKLTDGSMDYPSICMSDLKGPLRVFTDDDTKTFVSIWGTGNGTEEKTFTMDFGKSFRVKSQAYAIQCRDGFPTRVRDAVICGSNDNAVWTLLTEKPAVTSHDMQILNIKEKERNNVYRYIREIIHAVSDLGYEEATPIQAESIEEILAGKDVIGQAQTGTGKTAAFGIPCIERINPEDRRLQALILCPTRELAIQVCEEIKKLLKYKESIRALPVYGGQPIDRQILALKKGAQIVIGTPGRIMDHMERRTLKLETVNIAVLDEADEMLDMGFREDIETILNKTNPERQTVMFSATMSEEILSLTKKYQKDPKYIKVVRKELTVPNTEQIYFEVKEKTKLEALCRIIDMYNPDLSMVFCNTKKKVDEVVEQLQGRGYFAEGLHGDMKQAQRDMVMKKFRNRTIEILVATDVAARGIDVDDISFVFNYDLPQDEEYYVHRVGRTGRAGKSGRAYTFVVGKEIYKLREIMHFTKSKITQQKLPSLNDIEEAKTKVFVEKVKAVIDEGRLSKYINITEGMISDDYSALDIAAALMKMHLYDESSDDVNFDEDLYEQSHEENMVRMFVNAGKSSKIKVKDVVGAIAGEAGIPGKAIGSIEIYDDFTFVDVPSEYVKDIEKGMKNKKIKGVKVNIERARKDKKKKK